MKKNLISFFFLITSSVYSIAQSTIQWQKSLGGSWIDAATSIQQTTDGGYIVAGSSFSVNGDVTGNHGNFDYWIVKIDSSGSIQWQKSLGGSDKDDAYSIQQSTDGGYIVAGRSYSNDGNVTGNHGGEDYWIVKLSSLGVIQWQKSLGGTYNDVASSIQQTIDGGYIVAGSSNSIDGEVTGNHGNDDYWVVKLDSIGSIQWQKSLGGSYNDAATFIQQTIDGEFIVAGRSYSNDSNVTGNHGGEDYWIVKLSSLGVIQWQKSLGGTGSSDAPSSIQQTTDSGYIVGGFTGSNDGDVTLNHGNLDSWIIKLDGTGNIQWQKSLGGTLNDVALSIEQTIDSGYIVAGISGSNDVDVTGNHGNDDYWVVKLTSLGAIQWQKSLGGSYSDRAYSIQQTSDGGYVIAGVTESNDGDVSGNHGGIDYWIVKLAPTVGIEENNNAVSEFKIFPNPISYSTSISFFVSESKNVTVVIYDVIGREIKSLIHSTFNPGINYLSWDANNNLGNRVEDGIYLVRIETENGVQTKRVVVMKSDPKI